MLVEAGASLTNTDYQGNTPRLQALKAEDSELAEYLESECLPPHPPLPPLPKADLPTQGRRFV